MTTEELLPGQWPRLDRPEVRAWLTALARRHLRGYQHLVDDVVARSAHKWSTIAPEKAGVARIERVIASEAASVLRSEARARARDTRVYGDPTLAAAGPRPASPAEEVALLRLAIADACRRQGWMPTTFDLEVIEHLLAGASIADATRALGVARHKVKASIARWRPVLRSAELGPLSSPSREACSTQPGEA